MWIFFMEYFYDFKNIYVTYFFKQKTQKNARR